MPWECKTVEKQRLEFVTKALETNNFSALCREYEITRKTGRKWVDRFKQGLPLTDICHADHYVLLTKRLTTLKN